ncbi:MAG: ABC transporter permease [Ignavibacteriaceae bacterium]|jgi:putative ABC transport system permease protein
MLKNYFKVALRNLLNQKFYSVINIVGLSIGITAYILVGLYIKQDFSYDKYHKNAEQIYRIEFSISQSGQTSYSAQTPALLGPTLKNVYPEIKKFSRIYFSEHNLVKVGEMKNYEDRISYADSTFFEIFSYEAIVGNKTQFLKKANSIILTESTAKKYFGNENPLGKELEINNKYRFEVTGVIKDVPINSHFKFDFLATYSSLNQQSEATYLPQWGATFGSYTYMLAERGFDSKNFEKKAENFFKTYTNITSESWRVHTRPLLSIHLNSHLDDEIEENSSMSRIVILSSIALFILLLACINFVNLATARSSKRAVEIGIRKVLGAFKIQLIKQFLSESVLLSLISLIISLITVIIVIPFFSELVGTEIGYDLNNNWMTLLLIVVGVLTVGVLAGLYPALFISSYQPIKAIRGINSSNSGKKSASYLRKGLVVLQFAISIILIAGTIIINLQLKYLREYNMGFDKEYMLVLPAHDEVGKNYTTIKNELKNIPGVASATACEGAPISMNGTDTECRPKGLGSSEAFRIHVNSVDFDYMNHFGIKVIAGRNFSTEFQNDYSKAMVINEKMVKSLGFKNAQEAIGKSYFISLNGYKPEIIGVVKDYNSNSLHNEVLPQVFMHIPRWFSEFTVKVNSANVSMTIGRLKDVWAKFFPRYPFEYRFLDESIDKMYKAEARYSNVISTFSAIALFIACLGLLGLTSYVTEQRKKEIGIRKVLGASVQSIIKTISSEFVILVVVANVIAWPIAYCFMSAWLQDFAYRIDISIWIFIISGGIALLIAMFTVGYQAVKAALANPVKSLKYE